ncbi:LmeA family phospholipid-binding protein [Nocardioides sp.]|uniref:LmeA family phospholipid-binding protein n=1 Tax=Nocardioides sp. TaxID=35761 RepID=UPI002ED82425
MRRRILLVLTLLTLVAAAGTEVGLPPLAESRVRDRLDALGQVTDVEVSSRPAVKLLAGQVDQAVVRMSSATLDTAGLDPELLTKAERVDTLQARVDTLRAGPLDIDGVLLDKRGDRLDASAHVDLEQLRELLPGADLNVSHGNLVLELARLPIPIPLPGPLRLRIDAEDGRVVARPTGVAAGLLPAQTLLDRPELAVTDLQGDLTDDDLRLEASATLTPSS